MKSSIRLGYVVPTKDRPNDLRNLLRSLRAQTKRPDQIIIVDGSEPVIRPIIDEFSDLSIDYVRVFPPSLAAQRNAGMAALAEGIDVAGYLDDDLVLEPEATERMASFWERADSDVGGAAFSILNQPKAKSDLLTRTFLLNSPVPGRMLCSGFQSQIPALFENTETDWLYGGATMWRRDVIKKFRYDEWYIGHGYLEDVDFSYRVSRSYRLFVVGDAQVNHYTRPIRVEAQFKIGQQQIANRLYMARKIGGFSRLAFTWAMIGQVVSNLIAGILKADRGRLRCFAGNLSALPVLLTGSKQISVYYK